MDTWGWLALLVAGAACLLLWLRSRQAQAQARAAETRARVLERAQAELAARVEDVVRRQRQIEAATSDPILLINRERTVVEANPAAVRVFGDAAGRTLLEVVRDADLHHSVMETLADGRPRTLPLNLLGRGYDVTLVNGSADIAITFRDVTELYRLQRARRDFVANISHELRTPLTSLGLLCETLQATEAANGSERRLVSTIASEVAALRQLVTDMLDLSQIEDGRMVIRLAPMAAAELVETAVTRLAPQAQSRDIALETHVDGQIRVLADGDKIVRVLTNLLDNAVKYSPAGKAVTVTVQPAEDFGAGGGHVQAGDVVFTVADQGPGIASGDLPRVFERFFKVDRARERGTGMGAGLGLAIARHLVEAHGGQIWVSSVEGRGAMFCFTLPEA
ncbi:MAG: ATP-binding protein [Anaerolineae bacterium]